MQHAKSEKTLEFIERSRTIHGTDKYNYSEVVYVTRLTPVTIHCKIHNIYFTQSPKVHLRGSGCNKCGKLLAGSKRRLTTEQFIEKAIEVHGNRYDYSLIDYKDAKSKVSIVCRTHGQFKLSPNSHLSKRTGCRKCSDDAASIRLRLTTEQFIEKAIAIHGDRYDYSEVDYIDSHTKVIILCSIHGQFEQTPNCHLTGAGCRTCAGCYKSNTDEFIIKSIAVHGEDKYDYSQVDYKDAKTKVNVVCRVHGSFGITPGNHLNGQGCTRCGHNMQIFTTEEFINAAKQFHGEDAYEYSRVCYSKMSAPVIITCKIHGDFKQTPSNHITHRQGCSFCIYKTKTILYYFLENLNLCDIIVEKTFKDCKNMRLLPFDYFLEKYNILIELDGDHHFKYIHHFHRSDVESFVKRQKTDFKKMNYALSQGYTIIRIYQPDVLKYTYDWKEEIIKNIKFYDTPQIIYLSSGNQYQEYNDRYQEYKSKIEQPFIPLCQ